MNRHHFVKVSGAALSLALLSVGATTVQSRNAIEATVAQAERDAADAGRALAKGKPLVAIGLAEHAVSLRPQDATYRALLGRAYLAAGRYISAKQAFGDALQLDAGIGVALNFALTTTATGDFAAAQQILATHGDAIPAADRGLALALAGDPDGGVQVLTAAARTPGATAKTRQNLALALALAGRWPEARMMATVDLSPADADVRIAQWATFARPAAASDQVSQLLGIVPVADGGVPAELALVGAATGVVAVEAPAAAEPAEPAVAEPAPTAPAPVAAVVPAPATEAPVAVAAVSAPAIVFGERREVAQPLPARAVAKPPVPRAARIVPPARVAAALVARSAHATPAATGGRYYVQLGAFRSVEGARKAWTSARARTAGLGGKAASTMVVAGGLNRLSVGGFDKRGAAQLCRSIRANGGVCFVRTGAGDRLASWGSARLASR